LQRGREQALEVGGADRLRIGLMADVGGRDLDQARDRLALDADRGQVRRDADRPTTWASSSNLAGAAARFQARTVSIISALARPWCRSQTVPSACAHEWTAPRSFWNAIAPIIELIIMSARACRLPGSRTAVTSARAAMRVPSRAMPSQSG
jgi:hypothetical protein